MKDKTKVKPRNVGKVAELKAKDPHITYREINEKTWLAQNTINKANKELKQNWTKDPTIAYIVGASKERLQKIQQVLDRFVEESFEKEKLNRSDTSLIKDIARDDLQRITVFGWDVTDDKWGLKWEVVDKKQIEAIEAIRNMFKID
jgi:DNA-binding transcriptional regulator YhcF (GntR family)